jgi:membrane protease YdiL (CAAX protease family)
MVLAFLVGLAAGAVVAAALVIAALVALPDLPETAAFVVAGSATYAGVGLAVWGFCARRHHTSWTALGVRPTTAGVIVAMLPLSVALLVANAILLVLTALVTGGARNPQGEALAPGGVLSTANFAWLLLLVAVVGPVVEELFFRGMLYRYLRARRSVAAAVLLSAALFAVVHVIPVLFAPLFMMGVALALVAERFGSIVPAIVLHGFNNAISLTLLYLSSARG